MDAPVGLAMGHQPVIDRTSERRRASGGIARSTMVFDATALIEKQLGHPPMTARRGENAKAWKAQPTGGNAGDNGRRSTSISVAASMVIVDRSHRSNPRSRFGHGLDEIAE